MKKIALLILLSTTLFSCKRTKEEIIVKKWQAVNVENPAMDTIMMQQQMFIDTVGKHTDAATNKEMYGVDNLDSLRKELQMQLDSFKIMQEAAIQKTEFNFLKGGKALINFGAGDVDSCKWAFDEDGKSLIIDEIKKGAGGPADKIKMQIVELDDTMMKLRLNESGTKSTVIFKPSKK